MSNELLRDRGQIQQAFNKINQSWSFDGAHLELSTDARHNDIIDFMIGHFLPDEPLSRSIRLVDDIKYGLWLKTILEHNLSVLLVSDVTNDIVGVRIISVMKKQNFDLIATIPSEKKRTIYTFTGQKDPEMDVFRYYGVDVALHFVALGIHKAYRKRGFGFRLMQAAIDFCQELGLDPVCIKGEGTSNFSKRIYEKCGFESLHEMKYDQYKKDGEVVFNNTGEHRSCKIYVKRLR